MFIRMMNECVQRSISIIEVVIDEKLSRKTNPGNGTFLFDLIWKVNG